MKATTIVALALLAVALSGCGPREVLLAKDPAVPAGVDLSGRWQLRSESNETFSQLQRDRARAAGGDSIVRESKRKSDSSREKGSLLHVFLPTGTALKVTQTDTGLFISFDRSIVREYRFGEYRNINVGPVVASRVSGWENDGYIIETLDEEGNKLVERYLLEDAGKLLMRQISIYEKGKLTLSLVQKFDRA